VIFLFLRILFNLSFAQLLKLAQARDGQILPAALVNYLVAALLSGLGIALLRPPTPQGISLGLGVANGLTYALSLLSMETALQASGISITVAVLQLSVLVPTLASILIFQERPDLGQGFGIAAALPSLWLLSGSRAVPDGPRIPLRKATAALLSLFLITGGSGVAMKAFEVYARPTDRLAYSAALFATATLVIGIAVVREARAWGRLAWPVGSLIGLSNLLQLEATLKALALLPAILVFPISSALTVSFNTLLSVWLWKERLNYRSRLGIALAVLSAILMNWRR